MPKITTHLDHRFCVAPLLDLTTRHQRYFMRLISQHAVLYTEMITTGAIIYGDRDRYLQYNEAEHPVAIQLGGSEPKDMAACASLAENYGYNEININVGCPSERVQKGAFGACLMLEPELIAECVGEMKVAASHTPITVKNRIGVDDNDSYDELTRFIDVISTAGCNTFIIHARKAWLKGLSPKQNREIPPLTYPTVYQLKKDFPQLEFIINGGIKTMPECQQHLEQVDGVMLGREAYHNPYAMIEVDPLLYQSDKAMPKAIPRTIPSRYEVLDKFITYTEEQLSKGVPLNHMTRHILGLFHAQSGAKLWRRHLSENATKQGAGIKVLQQAIAIQQAAQKEQEESKNNLNIQQKTFDLKNT